MGVKHLWGFITPARKYVDVESLKGQIIAVDLSIWIVEAQAQIPKHIAKPHLRHLFFRVNHLLQLGVIPLIVVEGIPPDLKQNTMRNRLGKGTVGSVRRTRFNALHRECCEMLEYMGLPYVQAAGEAEAMCAYMNAEGIVDGCITNDGDAFLYGAKIVYRNFTVNQKNSKVEAYDVADIEDMMMLSRETLVGLAVLCGCDYLPKGVEGCGKESIKKLLETLNGDSLLDRFKKWTAMDKHLLGYKFPRIPGYDEIELAICKKASAHPDFPFQKVISEFMVNKNKIPKVRTTWSHPNLLKLIKFAYEKMEWPEEYTVSKVIPLITLHDMKNIISGISTPDKCIRPKMLVKSRVRQGEPCYEVQWEKLDEDIITKEEYYVTLEEQHLLESAFPTLVKEYESQKDQKKNFSKRTTKLQKKEIPKDVQELDALINGMNISEGNKIDKQEGIKCNKKTSKDVSNKQVNEICGHGQLLQNSPSDVLDDDSSKDGSPYEFIPLRERLRLQASGNVTMNQQVIARILCTPKPPKGQVQDLKPSIKYLPSKAEMVNLNSSLDKDLFGNFEIETSLLDFSICQTPRMAQKHESILTPNLKIEILTPVKLRNTPQLHPALNNNLNDSIEIELPLLERLRRKMGKM